MPQHLHTHILLVISDTPVQKIGDQVFAFEPVLREMEALSTIFEKIIWLGCTKGTAEVIMKKCDNDRVQIVAMPATSHSSFNWLRNLLNYPSYFQHIVKHSKNIKHIHTRGPSHPAIISFLLSAFDTNRLYWHKYAGNWNNKNIPGSYRFQQSILRTISSDIVKTTINGNWDEHNRNILSFENPCISESEVEGARAIANVKDFSGNLSLLFVGNLNVNKGVVNLMHALLNLELGKIDEIFIVGDGTARTVVEKLASGIKKVQVHIVGAVSREKLNEYYKKCHLLIVPSISEGFPKVVAEAAAYGCVPVVTSVSAIPQHVEHMHNGYLLENNDPGTINKALEELLAYDDIKKLSMSAPGIAGAFTYERYIARVKNEIFNL